MGLLEKILSIRLKGDERDLASALGRAKRDIQSFSQGTIGAFRATDRRIKAFADAHVNQITGLLGGISAGLIAKQQIDFQARLVRMKIEGRASASEIEELRKQIFEVGRVMHQDPGALLSGVDRIVEKIGDFKFAKEHLEGMAMAATATGASMEDIGALAADLKQKFGVDKDLFDAMDILFAQGKTGAFRFQDFATQGERVTAAASSMLGLKGVQGVRQMGALLQMAKSATGSPEEAATSFENFAREIVKNAKKLEKLGIKVWDPVASKKQGRAVVRDVTELMKDISAKTNFDPIKLSKVFDIRSYRLIASFVDNMKKNGGMERYLELVNQKTGEAKNGFNDFSETASAQLTSLTAEAKEFANTNLAAPLKGLKEIARFLNENPMFAKILMYGGTAAVGGLVLRKFLPSFEGKGKGGIGEGVAGMAGVQKVYVVNMPGAGLPGAAEGAAGGTAARTAGRFAAGGALTTAGILGANVLGAGMYYAAVKDQQTGRFAGIPAMDRRNAQSVLGIGGAPENKINLTVNIDKDGRHTVSQEGKTKTQITVNRGKH